MYKHETQIRVRYGETDRMGFVYYGFYSFYYEIGRTEAIRNLGTSYKQLEDDGIILPVSEMHIQYVLPATYDDEITIITTISEMPTVKIKFTYELINQKGQTINFGKTTLAFVNKDSLKPCRPPEYLLHQLKPYFSKKE